MHIQIRLCHPLIESLFNQLKILKKIKRPPDYKHQLTGIQLSNQVLNKIIIVLEWFKTAEYQPHPKSRFNDKFLHYQLRPLYKFSVNFTYKKAQTNHSVAKPKFRLILRRQTTKCIICPSTNFTLTAAQCSTFKRNRERLNFTT